MAGPTTHQSGPRTKRKSRESAAAEAQSGTGKKQRTTDGEDHDHSGDQTEAGTSKPKNTRTRNPVADDGDGSEERETTDEELSTDGPLEPTTSQRLSLTAQQLLQKKKKKDAWKVKQKAKKASITSALKAVSQPPVTSTTPPRRSKTKRKGRGSFDASGSPGPSKRNRVRGSDEDGDGDEDDVGPTLRAVRRKRTNQGGQGDEEPEEGEREEVQGGQTTEDEESGMDDPNSRGMGLSKKKGKGVDRAPQPTKPGTKGTRWNRKRQPSPNHSSKEESDSGEDETPVLKNKEGLLLHWFGKLVNNRDRLLTISKNHERVAREVQQAHIGDAAISFAGVGDVESVVDLSDDPNKLGNPRGVYQDHVHNIYTVVKRPGGKKDHEAPIILLVDGNLIDEAMRAKMRNARAEDALCPMPNFTLNNITPREDALEQEVWRQQRNGEWLDAAELVGSKAELSGMRSNRNRATLLNGRHRILAMLMFARELLNEREEIRASLIAGTGDEHDLFSRLEKFEDRVLEDLIWRVKVYDRNLLSDDAKNFLVHNDHKRPAKDAGVSEKLWWLANKFDLEIFAEMGKQIDGRPVTRAEAMNIVQARWLEDLNQTPGTIEDMIAVADKPKKGKKLGDKAGTDNSSRLFFNSVTAEMVLNTRHAMWAFESSLDKKAAVTMLRPQGAALVAHYWMALRTLLSIFDCGKGPGVALTDGETWLDHHAEILVDGYPEAAQHYEALHSSPERVPQLLPLYNEAQAGQFWKLYEKEFSRWIGTGYIDYASEEVSLAFRRVFDAFGKLFTGEDEGLRRVSTAIRLFARLQLYQTGIEGSCFYPAAAFPCPELTRAHCERWLSGRDLPQKGDQTPDCLTVLESLLHRGQLIWTMGARPTSASCNWNNWYYRPRGLHQIVLRLYEQTQIGPVEARLSEAIYLLEDPRLTIALHAISDQLSAGKLSLNDALTAFSARKSGKHQYPGILHLTEAFEDNHGTLEDIIAALSKLRLAIKSAVVELRPLKPEQLPAQSRELWQRIATDHPICELLDPKHREQAFPDFYLGWKDQLKRLPLTAGMGVGWGLLEHWFNEVKLHEVLNSEEAQWILVVVDRVLELSGEAAWWDFELPDEELPIPQPLPRYLLTNSERGMRQLRAEQKRHEKEQAAAAESASEKTKKPRKVPPKPKTTGEQGLGSTAASGRRASQRIASKSKDAKGGGMNSSEPNNPKSKEMISSSEDESVQEESTPSKSSKTSKVLPTSSLLAEPLFGPNPDVRKFTDILETSIEWHERDKLPRGLGGDWPEPPVGFDYYHQAVNELPLASHITATRLGSLRLPHHVWSRVFSTWMAIKPTLAERSELQKHVTQALQFNSADLLVGYCALAFNAHVDMNPEEAVHEVDIMFTRDGLFQAEIASIHNGYLVLDLTSTFPLEQQQHGMSHCFKVHVLATTPLEDRDLVSILQHVMGSYGLGRTESESRERGMRAVELQYTRLQAESEHPDVLHGRNVDFSTVETTQPAVFRPRDPKDEFGAPREWDATKPSLVVNKLPHSPFSTGDFDCTSLAPQAMRLMTGMRIYIAKYQSLARELNTAWQEATTYDAQIFEHWRALWSQGRPLPDIPVEDDTYEPPAPENAASSSSPIGGAKPKLPESSARSQNAGRSTSRPTVRSFVPPSQTSQHQPSLPPPRNPVRSKATNSFREVEQALEPTHSSPRLAPYGVPSDSQSLGGTQQLNPNHRLVSSSPGSNPFASSGILASNQEAHQKKLEFKEQLHREAGKARRKPLFGPGQTPDVPLFRPSSSQVPSTSVTPTRPPVGAAQIQVEEVGDELLDVYETEPDGIERDETEPMEEDQDVGSSKSTINASFRDLVLQRHSGGLLNLGFFGVDGEIEGDETESIAPGELRSPYHGNIGNDQPEAQVVDLPLHSTLAAGPPPSESPTVEQPHFKGRKRYSDGLQLLTKGAQK
ncbi:hypothetical protein RhiJN_07893 [Ceratobasidium sp. AG-Ba]|nr:hypothetical protein RhiJN_07893 [Ceratobasidium sp. AG-Ba]